MKTRGMEWSLDMDYEWRWVLGYVFSRLRLYSLKGRRARRKDVSSAAVLTDLENELNRSKQEEERIRHLDKA